MSRDCDVCGKFVFYFDANNDWFYYIGTRNRDDMLLFNGTPMPCDWGEGEYNEVTGMASWAVVCSDCRETHIARVLTREQERALFGADTKEE